MYHTHTIGQPKAITHLDPEFLKVALTCVIDRSCAADGLDSSNVTERPPFSNATNDGGGGWASAAAAAANVNPSTPPEVAAAAAAGGAGAGAPAGVPVPPGSGDGAGAKGSTKPAAAAGGGCGCGNYARKHSGIHNNSKTTHVVGMYELSRGG